MKRIYKIIASVTAGLLIVTLTVTTIVFHSQKQSLKNQLTAFYSKAFEQLMTDVTSLEAKLYKLNASNGLNQYTMLLMDVWRQTGDTESALAALPISYQSTSTLTQFINRTGDYCHFLADKIARGESITDEDFEQIKQLAQSCGEVYDELGNLWQQGYPGDQGFSDDVFLPSDVQAGTLDFANQNFPRLVYDGPFSESTEDKQPEGLAGAEVTREQAAQAAAAFLGVDASTLSDAGEQNGTIPCFGFSGEQNGKSFEIYISKKGGQVHWYMSTGDGGISAVPTDEKYKQLTGAAQQYLIDKGYGESESSYAQFYNGMAVINLAPVEDDVVLYSDLIKVWVDIPTATVMGLDAHNYLMSHKERNIEKPTLTEEEAKQKLTTSLQVKSARLALIPMDTNEEKLCWEFTCSDGQDFLIYINAQTGVEEDIMMIQHTNNGTLVM
jgi:germination protein YpeB